MTITWPATFLSGRRKMRSRIGVMLVWLGFTAWSQEWYGQDGAKWGSNCCTQTWGTLCKPPPPTPTPRTTTSAAELHLWEGRQSRHSPPVAHVVFGCMQVVIYFFSCPASSFFFITLTQIVQQYVILHLTGFLWPFHFFLLPSLASSTCRKSSAQASSKEQTPSICLIFFFFLPQFYIFYLQTISFLPPCWNFTCASLVRHLSGPHCT